MANKKREQQLRESIELMFFAYRAFTRGPDKILTKRGLGRVHHRILYFIGRNPGLSVNDLLQVLEISKQALHQPQQQLVSMGLIKIEKSKADGRVRELRLTTAGKNLEARLTGTQQLHLENVFAECGKKGENAWQEVMRQIADE